MNSYLNVLYPFLLLATIVGFARRRFLETHFQKMLPFLLLFICIVQIIAIEYSRPVPQKSNHWIYNIYTPIECLFYSFLLLERVTISLLRKTGIALIIVYCLFSLYNVFFLQGFWFFNNYSYVVGAFSIVCIGLFFFIENAISETDQPVLKNPLFWFASGLIISQLGNFIIMGLFEYLLKNNTQYLIWGFTILKYLNTLMYLLFIIGFICNRPKKIAKGELL